MQLQTDQATQTPQSVYSCLAFDVDCFAVASVVRLKLVLTVRTGDGFRPRDYKRF